MNTELLAPVGSFDALKAAVQNGANAVYLGGKEFSARASANNFDRDELREAVRYAHIRGVQVFVTANTLRKQNEIEEFLEYIKYLYDIDVDAIILQDIGMARLVKELLPDFEIHASTQMVAHSLEDVLYLQNIGFDRVVLARELNIQEIEHICKNSNVDIEVFVHGALCVCYSGQCLMSSMLGNRSGNRGRCAQPCRQKYELIDIYSGEVINTDGEYLLSPKDLNSIQDIDKVIEAGVHSLKIEGRMKRPEYVATVIGSYRKTIDEYMETKKINVSDETMNNLYTIFNRKFTKGYLFGDVGEDIMNSNRPNNLGLYIGKVVDYNRKAKRLKIKLENILKKGDGISIGGGTIGRIIKSNGDIANIGYKGETIELDFIGDAKRNQIIYKTSDSDLLNTVQKTFEEDTENVKVSIDAKIEIKLGKKPRLTLCDSFGNTTTLEADKEVEQAMKVALSEEKVVTQISKLGNTSYIINNITVDMDDNVSLPISILNQIRRDAIESLSEERVAIKNRAYKNKEIAYNPKIFIRDDEVKLRAKVKNIEQLKAIVNYKEIDAIYYEDINTLDEAKTIANENNMNLIYSVPRVLRNKDYKILNKLDKNSNIEVQTGNLGCVSLFKDNGIYIDYYLNSFNSETINHYKQEGAKTICISQELNLTEIKETLKHTDAEIESVVYGYTPLMISEYCPMGVLVRDCKKDKRSAICNKSVYALKDSKEEVFRITQDIFCRSSIYNSKPLCMIDDLIDVKNSGINVFRLDFTFEDASQVKEVVEAHIEVINNDFEMDTKAKQFYNSLDKIGITKAHYYKGVE
ncbi:MAG: U32 family peptidase [Peptostreptococcaceae bacterium]|nr:U32 family peptidase [Peptostreptococcaceae bacterium]